MSFEPVDGFSSNLHQYITMTSLRADLILVMTSFLYVEYFLNQRVDFFKIASIYHCDKLKSLLDFGTLT